MMKKLFTILTMVFFTLPLISQKSDKDYLKEAPPIPPDACLLSREEVDTLIAKIERLEQSVSSEHERYSEEIDAFMNENEDNVNANMAARSGISQEEMAKLQSGKMTETEKNAMINRMMQQQVNMSMSEAKAASQMSDEEREAWAQGYASRQAASAQTNPSASRAEQQKSATLFELTNKRQQLNDSLSTVESDFALRFNEIANDPSIKASVDSIEVWSNRLTSMMGIVTDSEAKVMDKLAKNICSERKKLCSLYTSKYIVVLKDYQVYVKSSLKAYDRLEKLNFDLIGLQTGVSYPRKPGQAGYSSVLNYLGSMKGYLRFNTECIY